MNKKEAVFTSAVVYLSDCSENACDFIDKLIMKLEERFQHYEIIVVDDCCKKQDGFLKEYIHNTENKFLTVLHMSVRQGIEACMRAGIDTAIGDFVYEFDTLEYDFEKDLIWKSYEKALDGNDIVSVEIRHNTFSRKLFYKLFNKYSQSEYSIHASIFRLISRRAINRVMSLNINCEYRQAVYSSCGLKNGVIEYEGIASKKKARGVSLAIDSFILYTDLPKAVCMNSLKLCLVLGMLSVVAFILNGINPSGWTTSFMFGILVVGMIDIMICLFTLISYARLILNGAIEGKNYLIEDIQKIQR